MTRHDFNTSTKNERRKFYTQKLVEMCRQPAYDVKQISRLIKKGADVNGFGLYDLTHSSVLMSAAENGNNPLIDFLIRAGADVTLKNAFGETALMRATLYAQADTVRLLVKKGADVHAQDLEKNSAYDYSEHRPSTRAFFDIYIEGQRIKAIKRAKKQEKKRIKKQKRVKGKIQDMHTSKRKITIKHATFKK